MANYALRHQSVSTGVGSRSVLPGYSRIFPFCISMHSPSLPTDLMYLLVVKGNLGRVLPVQASDFVLMLQLTYYSLLYMPWRLMQSFSGKSCACWRIR